MARVVNKVKKNGQKIRRARRHAVKAASKRTSAHQAAALNEKIDETIRPARIGKNNSLIKPTVLSKKKQKLVAKAIKFAKMNAAKSEAPATMEIETVKPGKLFSS
jgi:hypothetical protein